MSETTNATNRTAFERIITPIKEWGERLGRANTNNDSVLDAGEVASMAIEGWRNNPNNNDASLTKLQKLAAQSAAMRDEIDAASGNRDSRDLRTMLLSRVVAPMMDPTKRDPLPDTNILNATLRHDLQRFAKDTGQALPDGGKAIADEVTQGMQALKLIQNGLQIQTQGVRKLVADNQREMGDDKTALANRQAEDAKLAAWVKEQRSAIMTPESLLAKVTAGAEKSGKPIPPEVQAAFMNEMRQAMGPESREISAQVLSNGIDGIKKRVIQEDAAGKLSSAFGKEMSGKGGLVEQGQQAISATARAQLEALKQIKIGTPNADGDVPRGTRSAADVAAMREAILANEVGANRSLAEAGRQTSAQMNPKALNAILISALDSAKESILQTPEQVAQERLANDPSFTAKQLENILQARAAIGGFTNVEQPTVQQFSKAVQAEAAKGR